METAGSVKVSAEMDIANPRLNLVLYLTVGESLHSPSGGIQQLNNKQRSAQKRSTSVESVRYL